MVMARAELLGRIEKLRGPKGGYAHSHVGLSAFWRQMEVDLGAAEETAEETAGLHALQGWFQEGPRNVVVLCADEALRQRVLCRFALSLAANKSVFIVFLPISAGVGTRTERDALKLMMGLFPNSEGARFTIPRSPAELKWALSFALGGRGVSAEDPNEEDPLVLLVVDGLDRLADAAPEGLFPSLHDMGDETRVLVAAAVDTLPFGEGSLLERLGGEEETLGRVVFGEGAKVPRSERKSASEKGRLESEGAATQALGGLEQPCLEVLSVALAPLSVEDMGWLLGIVEEAPLRELESILSGLVGSGTVAEGQQNPSGKPWVAPGKSWLQRGGYPVLRRLEDGKVCFVNDGVRGAFSLGVDERAWEEKVVARALAALRDGEWTATKQRAPGYVVEHLGAHLVRCFEEATPGDVGTPRPSEIGALTNNVDVATWMLLESPAWFLLWKGRPGWLTGFVTDVRRARRVVHLALFEASSEGERAKLLGDFVRCVVVEAALFSMEGSRTGARDRSLPFVEPTLQNAEVSVADRRVVATLLTTLASTLNQDRWSEAHAFAEAARKEAGVDEGAISPITIPTMVGGVVCGIEPSAEFVDSGRAHPEEWMRRVISSEGYGKILHLAQVLPYLPESLREVAAEEAAAAYVDGSEDDALPLLLACGPWLPLERATALLDFLGNRWSTTFSRTLLGPAGLGEMVPLFRRLGGDLGVFEVARAVVEVFGWVGGERSGRSG